MHNSLPQSEVEQNPRRWGGRACELTAPLSLVSREGIDDVVFFFTASERSPEALPARHATTSKQRMPMLTAVR